jgi:3-deoxy-D-manno-octulosonate 8-phosphate phosphatase (KDO 8-P phosphatase)
MKWSNRIKKIRLLALDVDGVLTDGRIIVDNDGKETKFFDVQDGFGLVLFQKAGHKTAIISARAAGAVTARANDLKIDRIHQDAYPKSDAYQQILKDFKLKDEEVCFIGDDLPDLVVLKRVGFGVAVLNAVAEVKKAAHYVTVKKGGRGAVREVVELILKAQGKWGKVVSDFS